MADLTRAKMIARVLEHLGVKAAGQAASGEDTVIAGEMLDTVHAQQKTRGRAPFATSAFPPWSQDVFRDIIAGKLTTAFGLSPQRSQAIRSQAAMAIKELAAQTGKKRQLGTPIEADYF